VPSWVSASASICAVGLTASCVECVLAVHAEMRMPSVGRPRSRT
jgi:hypothetical protein